MKKTGKESQNPRRTTHRIFLFFLFRLNSLLHEFLEFVGWDTGACFAARSHYFARLGGLGRGRARRLRSWCRHQLTRRIGRAPPAAQLRMAFNSEARAAAAFPTEHFVAFDLGLRAG